MPVAFFQALGRTERDSGSQPDTVSSAPRSVPMKSPDHDSGYGDASTTGSASQRASKTGSRAGAMVYGVVMYDFQAERADELEAKAGEAIIVIAQSNPEWFVAKPIGRLGGPGLIPVSFVEIRDMASNTPVVNPQDAVRRAGIPRVEEWKKMAADYKNSSITLGKFEPAAAAAPQKQSLEQGMERMSLQQGTMRPPAANGPVQVGDLYDKDSPGARSNKLYHVATTAATTVHRSAEHGTAKYIRGQIFLTALRAHQRPYTEILLCRRQVLVCH